MDHINGVRFGFISFEAIQRQISKAESRKAAHKTQVRRTYVLHDGTRVRLGAGNILEESPEIAAICLSSGFPKPAQHPLHQIPIEQRANTKVLLIPIYLWNPATRHYDTRASHRTIYVLNNRAYGIDRVKHSKKTQSTPA